MKELYMTMSHIMVQYLSVTHWPPSMSHTSTSSFVITDASALFMFQLGRGRGKSHSKVFYEALMRQ